MVKFRMTAEMRYVKVGTDHEFWLARPSFALRDEFTRFVAEFDQAGEGHFVHEPVLDELGFEAYVDWLAAGEAGGLGDDFVPWSAYWLLQPQPLHVLAVGSLRHRLNPTMAERGGHIGYRVRPSARGRGLAKLLLGELLLAATERGICPVMAVCHDDNPASAAVLLALGAVEYEPTSAGNRQIRRFRFG